MQRKKTYRDVYVNHVEMGTSALPVARMRKFAMTKLLKLCVVIIIGYIIYSVYTKNKMASGPKDETMNIYDNVAVVKNKVVEPGQVADRNEGEASIKGENVEGEQRQVVDRRIKEEINKVFEEFKRNQEGKDAKEDVVETLEQDDIGNDIDGPADLNEDFVDSDIQAGDDNAVDQQPENLDDEENIADEFEDINEKEEEEERKLDQEIEELLAGAFGDAVKEVKEAHKDVFVDAPKEEVNKNIKPEADKDKHAAADKNIELQKIVEHLEFNLAVDKLGRRLNPVEINQLNNDARRNALRHDNDHEFPPLVTAVRQTTFNQIKQLIASVHHHLPGHKLYIYDLDLEEAQKKELMTICGVRMKHFMKLLFPTFVSNLDNMHWKPLVMQTALAEFGHIMWINPGYILASSEFAPLVHESHDRGVLVLGQTASYTTFAATHPDMLKFITTDQKKLAIEPHIEIRAILMHNTEAVHNNIMKVFAACALETSCMAPPGSKLACRFDFTGRKHADCHRYDESALNILLKNFFNFDVAMFTRRNSYFKNYDANYKPKLKQCRKVEDIKPNEL